MSAAMRTGERPPGAVHADGARSGDPHHPHPGTARGAPGRTPGGRPGRPAPGRPAGPVPAEARVTPGPDPVPVLAGTGRPSPGRPATTRPSTTSTELRSTATLIGTPIGGRWQTRCSVDLLRLTRTDGRVTASRRLTPSAEAAAGTERQREAEATLRALDRRLPVTPGRRLQSVVVTVGTQLRVLARLESRFGPIVVGGTGGGAVADVVAWLDAWPQDGDGPGTGSAAAGPDWQQRPLVFGPAVAAAVLVGVRLALASPAAGRLDGRQVLPPVTLTDLPVAHPEGTLDDAGNPAAAWEMVRRGRVTLPPRDPDTGLPPGRAVWLHDRSRLGPAAWFGLALAGPSPQRVPDGAVELLQCVEGIRRYHPDGRMRLLCVARAGPAGAPFPVALTGRPLTLLRAVTGLAGEPRASGCDHQVTAPSLVLPPAHSLERSSDFRIRAL